MVFSIRTQLILVAFASKKFIQNSDSLKLFINKCEKDYSIIRHGGIYVEQKWITENEIKSLQQDIFNLRFKANANREDDELFQASGLSNRVPGDINEFGKMDRLTCTIHSELPQCTVFSDVCQKVSQPICIRSAIDHKLEILKHELEKQLNKKLELAEQYYSISPTGSFLPRHMDERHEETKGDKGWCSCTRRSISWLLYLNDYDWDDEGILSGQGGAFRAYCRRMQAESNCGANEGNLQVGWLLLNHDEIDEIHSGANHQIFEPVFLDCWVKTPVGDSLGGDFEQEWHALYSLYVVRCNGRKNQKHQRKYLSKPFGPDSPTWPSHMEINTFDEFASALASQLPLQTQKKFRSVNDINGSKIVDVSPFGGTLVLFDSVTIPHEVLATTKGERLAIGGWFHERQQTFPEWYG